ncbi:MAG: CPBP family intramembrane metalloprotease [Oscillospiraceae bacterium]|nr:CPBP family intramembrane metalloprotease [Oscillospiraceae bacterium]
MEDGELIKKTTLASYKSVCARLGVIMCVYFICRILNGLVAVMINSRADALGSVALYSLHTVIAVVLCYLIPIYMAMILFNSFDRYDGKFRELYKKPRRLARAFGNFPAMYGLGFGTAILTLIVLRLISRVSGGETFIDELFRPTTMEPSTNIASVIIMVFLIVVVAPICEEFLVRGIIYDALKPYGCGIAIILSSILFGLMHGSMFMLFYTTALGFALAYIRYATDSLFVVTILHSIFNSVSGGLLLLSSLKEITNEQSKLVNTFQSLYTLSFMILIVLGVIAFIKRIPTIKKYKIHNPWNEVSAGKKTALFFLSAPVIIMLALAVNEHLNNILFLLMFRSFE